MSKPKEQSLGEFLKKLRTDKGYSIKKLSPKLEVNYSYLSKIENDHTTPSENFIEKMATIFNIDKEELMIRAGKVPEDVIRILQDNPQEAVKFLRKQFGD